MKGLVEHGMQRFGGEPVGPNGGEGIDNCPGCPFATFMATDPSGLKSGILSVRPEDVHLTAPGDGPIAGAVTFIRDLGGTIETFLDVSGTEVVAVSTPRERPVVAVGQDVGIVIDPETAVVLSA